MNVWVVTKYEEHSEDGDTESFLAVCATQLDALGVIEADGGTVVETRAINMRYSIGKDYWGERVTPEAITLEGEYRLGRHWNGRERVWIDDDSTVWRSKETWYVRPVEIIGFDREAMLEAIKQHDYAHGWRAEFDTDHVHAVSNRDEGVVTT